MSYRKQMIGKRFGRLIVIEEAGRSKSGKRLLKCQCDCGNITTVSYGSLTSGHTKSCGCIQKEVAANIGRTTATTHGMTNTPEFKSWDGMKQRCLNKNDKAYDKYGGRGITICDRWMRFENFFEDMGKKPSPHHSIDRIDNNGNYTPDNCRWAVARQQANNRRDNLVICFYDQKKTLAEWGRLLGILPETLSMRLKRGWSVFKTLTAPIRRVA